MANIAYYAVGIRTSWAKLARITYERRTAAKYMGVALDKLLIGTYVYLSENLLEHTHDGQVFDSLDSALAAIQSNSEERLNRETELQSKLESVREEPNA